ncbi:MAG: hypothetical protein HYZ27_05500, partial [Deltaproteobacteria bacterium]|nr:hypothetical protein [Deltaproteobacteria bacterium]
MARAAEAIDFDPAEHYQTLRTPHFLVVHPDGYERLAHRAARIAESAFERQTARYGWDLSGRVTIVLDDRSDSASGGAQISPSKTIYVSVAQPTAETSISDYDDWMETIIAHELAHVFHLDMVYGLPWVARQLFGKSFSLNGATAAWNTEGLGVYEETVSSGAGRGRSTYGDMVLRMAALDDAFPGIDEAYYEQTRWPWAGTAYLFGGRFQLWLAERYGEEALVHYHRAYASTPIPFVTWLSAKLVFGRTLESLWQEFGESVNEEARATFEAVESSTTGVTRFTRLTSLEGDAIAPRVTPDGLFVVFSHLSPFEGETVRVVPVEGGRDTILLRDVSSRTFGFGPDGSIYFHRTDIDALYSRKDHLERYDFVSKSSQALVPVDRAYGAPKRLERSSDPDVSRSGRHVAFVQRHQGQTQLVVARL